MGQDARRKSLPNNELRLNDPAVTHSGMEALGYAYRDCGSLACELAQYAP